VLVAGIGNIFLSDDGFGVEVAQRLAQRTLPPGVRAADFGIRGIHLAYELLEGYDALVLIDAVPMGRVPGTLALIEPEQVALPADDDGEGGGPAGGPMLDAHTMSPGVVLAMLATFGAEVGRIVIVGCEPASVAEGLGLSAPVAEAVDVAVDLLDEVIDDICQPAREESPR
jgi:hydrogenase maturation protease